MESTFSVIITYTTFTTFLRKRFFLGTSFQVNPICDKEHLKYSCNNGIIKAYGGDVVEIHINAQERCSCRYRNR